MGGAQEEWFSFPPRRRTRRGPDSVNRSLVVAEWRRAKRSLRAAEILTEEGFYEDALSRMYYAALHAAKAALHVRDVTAESHAGVRRMFGLYMIRSGEIEPKWSPYFQSFSIIV